MSNVENKVIVETLVTERGRLATLPRVFGPQHMMAFEPRVYHWERASEHRWILGIFHPIQRGLLYGPGA